MTEIGPHLLGRIPSPPDPRDFLLENFVGAALRTVNDPVALAKIADAELRQTTIAYKKWAATKYPDVTVTHWWKAFNALQQIYAPAPPPPPPSGNVVWTNPDAALDQGDYGTCVGNGCAQWGNTDPIEDHFDEKVARAIYYEATVIDGSPDDPDAPGGGQQGATVRSGVKALQNRGLLSQYAVTYSLSAMRTWLKTKGSVIVGSDWMNNMFNPDANGYVKPTGGIAGGHCFLALGDLVDEDAILFLNSWGTSWGLKGYFKMKTADFNTLLTNGGEAWTAVEI